MRLCFCIFVLIVSVVSGVCAEKPKLTLEQKLALARHLADEASQGKAESGRVLTGEFDFSLELKRCRKLGKLPNASQLNLPEDSDITAESSKEAQKRSAITGQKYVVDTSDDFVNGFYIGLVGGDEKASQARKEEMRKLAEMQKEWDKQAKVFSYQSHLFYLHSDYYPAHSTAIYALGEFEKVFDRYFSTDDGRFSLLKKISINIVKEKSPKRNTALSISDAGNFTLFIAWTKSLTIEEFCDAVASAVLSKIAYETAGKDAVGKVPVWLKMGMASQLEQSIRFGVSASLAQVASEYPPVMPEDIFKNTSTSSIAQAHSYWTLVSLEKASKSKSALSGFLKNAIAGEKPESRVKQIEVFKPRRYEFSLWWRCLITGEIWSRIGGVLSVERSAAEIARLAVLQVDTQEGQRIGLSVAKLWDERESIPVLIKQRILEIKVALTNINSAYLNALISLGRMYEALEKGEKEDFDNAKKDFILEYQHAQKISREIKTLIK